MASNVEVKVRCRDLNPVRAKAATLATSPPQDIEQRDTFFVVPSGRLKVREFRDGSGELIAYQRHNQLGPRESVYTRAASADARALVVALSRVLPVRGVVVKRRELFLVGRTRIHLDQVDGLGSFVELEVVLGDDPSVGGGVREAQELLATLDLERSALVAEAYIDLLEARQTPLGSVVE